MGTGGRKDPGVGGQEVGGRKDRSQGAGVRGQGSGIGCQGSEVDPQIAQIDADWGMVKSW